MNKNIIYEIKIKKLLEKLPHSPISPPANSILMSLLILFCNIKKGNRLLDCYAGRGGGISYEYY